MATSNNNDTPTTPPTNPTGNSPSPPLRMETTETPQLSQMSDPSVETQPQVYSPHEIEEARLLVNTVRNGFSNLVSRTTVHAEIERSRLASNTNLQALSSHSTSVPASHSGSAISPNLSNEAERLQEYAISNIPDDLRAGLADIQELIQATNSQHLESIVAEAEPTFRAGGRRAHRRRNYNRRSDMKELVHELMTKEADTINEDGVTMKNYTCKKCNRTICF